MAVALQKKLHLSFDWLSVFENSNEITEILKTDWQQRNHILLYDTCMGLDHDIKYPH